MGAFHGLLVLDKPGGITSRDAVNRAQRWFPRGTRIGHAGTLDPLATGVLVLCIGTATRLTEYVQRMSKVYRAGIVLGATSDSDDADGAIIPTPDAQTPTREAVERELAAFVGTIEQVPPAYSAAKVTGRRAYDLARKGKEFDLAARPVTIHRIDLETYAYPQLEITVYCGKGTYIRSLARDLGRNLGCGGYIASLRRRAIGSFNETDALPLDISAAEARQRLLPIERAVAELPRIALPKVEADRFLHGQRIAISAGPHGEVAVYDAEGRLLAVAQAADGELRPLKVLAGAHGT